MRKVRKGAFITKATAQLMRDFGSIQSPQNAFLLKPGALKILHVRMKQTLCQRTGAYQFLQKHPKAENVCYPTLKGDSISVALPPAHRKYLPDSSCGVVSLRGEGGRAAANLYEKEGFVKRMFMIRTRLLPASGQLDTVS